MRGLLAGKQLRLPLPAFTRGAVGTAPFPLPRATEREDYKMRSEFGRQYIL